MEKTQNNKPEATAVTSMTNKGFVMNNDVGKWTAFKPMMVHNFVKVKVFNFNQKFINGLHSWLQHFGLIYNYEQFKWDEELL